MKNTKYLFVLVLFFALMLNDGLAAITPNEIISRGKPAFSSNGDPSTMVDNIFGYGAFNVSAGAWIAIEVGEGPSEVFITWNNPGYSYSDVIAASSSCQQGTQIMVDYTIQVSSNSTNGADGDWTVVETITGNTVTNRGHLIPFNGASWVKIVISSGGGSLDEVEIFDMSGGGTDSWFFPGTSISANAFKGTVPEQNYADVVAANQPGFTPVMIRGGIPCMNSTSLAEDIDLYLESAGNVSYWAIEMGTNDAWGGSNYYAETFRANLQVVIDKCKENGIEPIVARMIGTNEAAAGWQVHPDFLTAIDELTEQNNLIAGPDFYTWFSTHAEDLSSDGVHPSASGAASMQRLWAEQMTSLYTGSVIPVAGISVYPVELSIMVGNTATIVATVLPNNATNNRVVWSSSNTDIVVVNPSGVITGIGEGEAQVTATTVDGGWTAGSTVTVLPDTVIDMYTLTITVTGSGSVEVNPAGSVFEENTVVTLTAVPDEGTDFLGWGGDGDGTSTELNVTMTGNMNITATFTTVLLCDNYESISLPFTQDGVGEFCWVTSGTIDFINSWNMDLVEINGEDVTNKWLNTLPEKINGNYYIHYVSSNAWSEFQIEGSGYVPETFELTVNTSVGGSVEPSGGIFESGAVITLTATPDEGYAFDGWSGDVSGESATTTVIMDSDKSVTATFIQEEEPPVYYSLNVNIIGNGSVNPNGGTYEEGTVVTLEAIPDAGNEFVSWSGDASGTSTNIIITIDTNKSIIATFQVSDVEICTDPAVVSLPFSQDGAGEYCWITSDDFAYINSWNVEKIEINGVDYSNTWSDSFPEKVGGNYYIYYHGLYPWSHFEAASSKSLKSDNSGNINVEVFPNPFDDKFNIYIKNPEIIESISLVNQIGKVIRVFGTEEISESMKIKSISKSGIYYLIIITSESNETIKIIKN